MHVLCGKRTRDPRGRKRARTTRTSGSAVWVCEDVMEESGNEIIKRRKLIQQARKLSNAIKK